VRAASFHSASFAGMCCTFPSGVHANWHEREDRWFLSISLSSAIGNGGVPELKLQLALYTRMWANDCRGVGEALHQTMWQSARIPNTPHLQQLQHTSSSRK